MTLLMVWREGPSERLWIVSDSRLTSRGPTGGFIRMTDRGAKVLEADLVLQTTGPGAPPHQIEKVGFAYAGSSLVALHAYVAVLPLWARVRSPGGEPLPSLEDFAQHLALFLREYGRDVAGAGQEGPTVCLLLGRCPKLGVVEAWSLSVQRVQRDVGCHVERLALGQGHIKFFGSGAAQAEAELAIVRPKDGVWRREPLHHLRARLRGEVSPDVGGGLQIGMATLEGFGLYSDVRFFEADSSCADEPLLSLPYRGFRLEEYGKIGDALAALPGVNG